MTDAIFSSRFKKKGEKYFINKFFKMSYHGLDITNLLPSSSKVVYFLLEKYKYMDNSSLNLFANQRG